eukprot:gene17968-21441_t
MTMANGSKYNCYVPNPTLDIDDVWMPIPSAADFAAALTPLEALPCIVHKVGWWTYEYCHNKHIRQVHIEKTAPEKTEITVEYVLGTLPYSNRVGEIKGLDADYQEKYTSQTVLALPDTLPYYSERYDGGTPCDLFQGSRQTEVRFYCNNDPIRTGQTYITEIAEPSSCNYILKIQTFLMCTHPVFKPKVDNVMEIECFSK